MSRTKEIRKGERLSKRQILVGSGEGRLFKWLEASDMAESSLNGSERDSVKGKEAGQDGRVVKVSFIIFWCKAQFSRPRRFYDSKVIAHSLHLVPGKIKKV